MADSPRSSIDGEDPLHLEHLEAQADDFYIRSLGHEVIDLWRQGTRLTQQQERTADEIYEAKLAYRSFNALRDHLEDADAQERLRRLKMFRAWKNHRLMAGAMQTWVTRHRENVVRRQIEENKNDRAGKAALGKWAQAANESQQKKERFKTFYLTLKIARRWRETIRERIRDQQIAELEQRYNYFRRKKDLKLMQNAMLRLKLKTDEHAATNAEADEHSERFQTRRTKSKAHEALTSMYTTAAKSVNMESAADEHYHKALALRVLSSDGRWRKQTRVILEREEVADEFRAIKDEEVAKRGLRAMRKTAAWGKKMEDEADAFCDRKTKALGHRALSKWRDAAASSRGETVVREPPATPAARMAALRQYQQSQRE